MTNPLFRFLRSSRFFRVVLALLGLAGGYLVYYSTAIAPWAFSDSTVYIAAGINWIKGSGMGFMQANGEFARLVHFPPGYPLLIGLTSLILPNPIDAARWINILSFVLLIFVGGLLIWKITRSRLLPLLYGAMLVLSPFLLVQFSGVMSEPPSILAGTLALLLLVRFIQTKKALHLVLAGLLAAAAVLMRYQQAAVMLAGGLLLLFFTQERWRIRIKNLLVYAVFSAGPLVLWLLVDALSAKANAPRAIGLRGDVLEITRVFLQNVYGAVKYWFPWRSNLLPGVDASVVRLTLATLFLALTVFGTLHFHKSRTDSNEISPTRQLISLSVLYLISDLVFLWAAMLFATPPPDVDIRMLSSLLPMLFILILGLEYLVSLVFKHKLWTKLVMVITAALFCVVFYPQVKDYTVTMHGYGEGYTSLTFNGSPLVMRVQELAQEHSIVTNSPALVQFFTLKEPYRTFEGLDDPAITATTMFGDDDTQAQRAFREDCAPLVLFDPDKIARLDLESGLYYPPEAYGVTKGLVEVFSDPLGKVYLYPGCEGRYPY